MNLILFYSSDASFWFIQELICHLLPSLSLQTTAIPGQNWNSSHVHASHQPDTLISEMPCISLKTAWNTHSFLVPNTTFRSAVNQNTILYTVQATHWSKATGFLGTHHPWKQWIKRFFTKMQKRPCFKRCTMKCSCKCLQTGCNKSEQNKIFNTF